MPDQSQQKNREVKRANAPFAPEQVKSLNGYQRVGYFHPFTCANRDAHGDDILVAQYNGMKCPSCDYVQTWAWDYMANGAWKRAVDEYMRITKRA